MSCKKIQRHLAEDPHGSLRDELQSHLESCSRCRRQAAASRNLLEAFASLQQVRPRVDVTGSVMAAVRREARAGGAVPLRGGLGRGGRWALGLSAAALSIQAVWTLWVLVAGGGVARILAPARLLGSAAWSLGVVVFELAASAGLVAFEIVGGVAAALDPLGPLLPFYYGAALVGFFLLLAAALGVTRWRPQPGALR